MFKITSPLPTFTEIAFDPDNNKYLFGISSEMEQTDETEIRKSGFVKMKVKGVYFRLWIFKTVFGIGIPRGFIIKKKNRNKFKFLLGVYGG
ncbi:MAG: DUF3977 family protein [Chthoniobacterales bacterium]